MPSFSQKNIHNPEVPGSNPGLATKPDTNVAGFFICAMSTGFICTSKANTWVQCSRGALSRILATKGLTFWDHFLFANSMHITPNGLSLF
jgi:hypothetical protein